MALQPVHVGQWRGLVFVAFDNAGLPLADGIERVRSRTRHRSAALRRLSEPRTQQLRADWKLACEHLLDLSHLAIARPALKPTVVRRRRPMPDAARWRCAPYVAWNDAAAAPSLASARLREVPARGHSARHGSHLRLAEPAAAVHAGSAGGDAGAAGGNRHMLHTRSQLRRAGCERRITRRAVRQRTGTTTRARAGHPDPGASCRTALLSQSGRPGRLARDRRDRTALVRRARACSRPSKVQHKPVRRRRDTQSGAGCRHDGVRPVCHQSERYR